MSLQRNMTEVQPPGMVMFFASSTLPSGWLKCNGAAVSRTAYPGLFSAIGTTYGAGDGSTTFALPELRGEFVRAWSDGRAVDTSRTFATSQGHGIPRMRGGITDSHGNSAMVPVDIGGGVNPFIGVNSTPWRTQIENVSSVFQYVEFDSNRVIPESPDVRPRNIALMACIKF